MQLYNFSHLVIEPDPADARNLKSLLLKLEIPDKNIAILPGLQEVLDMESGTFDVVYWSPTSDPSENRRTYDALRKKFSNPIVLAILASDHTGQAIELLRIGVADYLPKGEFDAKDLQKSLMISGEHKKLQEELERREARFRGLIENNFDGILLTDENRIITYASPSVEAITGYSPKELVGFPNTKFLSIEDQADNREVVDGLLSGALPDGLFKERYRTKDGELRWIETRVTDCRHIPGLSGYVVNFRDIHEEELANRARIQAEEKANLLIESTSDGVWQWNPKTKEMFWSDSIYKMLGYGFNDVLQNLSIEEIAHPDDRAKLRSIIKKNSANGRPFQIEFRAKNASGEYMWMRGDGSGLSGESGETELIIGTLRNINKRKSAEMALTESRALLKNLTHNLGGSVARHLVNNERMVEVVFMNRGSEEVFELSLEDIRNNPYAVWDNVVPDDFENLKEAVRTALRTQSGFEQVYRYHAPNGKVKHLHTRGTIYRMGDEVMIDTITMDATPLKDAQSEIVEHRALLKNILDNLSGSIQRYRRNTDGSYEMLYLSEGHSKITGLDLRTLTDDYSSSLSQMDPDHLESLKKKIEESANTLEPWNHIWRMVDAQGNEKWINGHGTPEAREDGTIIWNQVLTDITKLKETENELRRVNERFEFAARVAKLGVWEYNVETDELIWDDNMYEIFQIDRKQFKNTSKNWLDLLLVEDREQAQRDVDKIIESPEENYNTRFRIQDPKTGRIKHIRGAGQFTNSGDERGRVLVGFNWDVSAIEETRQKLMESNKRYELASAATSDAIWDWDVIENELVWSKGFHTVFGHHPKSYKDETNFWEKLIHPDEREAVVGSLTRFIKNSKRNRWESSYRLARADGTYAEVVDRGFVVRDETGKAVRMVGAIRDFTERIRVNRLLEEQNKKLRKIAWSQSHELRSPLSRILGLVDLIENRGVDDLEKSEIIGYLRQSAQDLDEVIHRIVRLSHDINLDEAPPGEE